MYLSSCYWKDNETTEKSSSHCFVHNMPKTARAWAKLKMEPWNSVWMCRMGGREPTAKEVTCCP